jgi:putative salt-induced outer membrane protein
VSRHKGIRAFGSRSGLAALLALIVVLLAKPVQAQAPAPAPAPAPEPPPRLEASGQFAFLNTRGNADTQSLGAGGELISRPDPWTYRAKAVFAQTESDDELSARSFAGLFRASRALNTRLSVYGQYDFLRDVFAGVEQRHVIEGGASYLAVDTAPHRLRFDAGLGYLYEEQPEDHFDSVTLSLGAAYRLAISATSELTYEPRFLLPFSDTSAWRFDQNAALAVALNSILSLKLSHTIRYSAAPPEGFEKTDTIMAVSLVAKVQRPR